MLFMRFEREKRGFGEFYATADLWTNYSVDWHYP